MKPKIDLNNLEFIPASQVPKRSRSWVRELLEKVPQGQAVVLKEDSSQYATIQNALRRFKKEGEFGTYEVHKHCDKMYVVNLSIGEN